MNNPPSNLPVPNKVSVNNEQNLVITSGQNGSRTQRTASGKYYDARELKFWIKKCQIAGYEINEIRKQLADKTGWTKKDIDTRFPELKVSGNGKVWLIGIITLILLGVGFFFIYPMITGPVAGKAVDLGNVELQRRCFTDDIGNIHNALSGGNVVRRVSISESTGDEFLDSELWLETSLEDSQELYDVLSTDRTFGAGDLNFDGLPDLISFPFDDGWIYWMRSTGQGFDLPRGISEGVDWDYSFVGHFDGDRTSDLFLGQILGDSIRWTFKKFSSVSGEFFNSNYGTTSIPDVPFMVLTGDFDGNIIDDIALIENPDNIGENFNVHVDLNFGGRSGVERDDRNWYFSNSANLDALGTGDFNSDGRDDIVFFDYGSLELKVLMNTNDRSDFDTLETWIQTAIADTPSLTKIGDFDGDGTDDLAIARSTNGQNEWTIYLSRRTSFVLDDDFNRRIGLTASDFVVENFDGDNCAAEDLPEGLVALYSYNGGSTNDVSGNGYHADNPFGVPCLLEENGCVFTGLEESYLEIPAEVIDTREELAVEVWVNPIYEEGTFLSTFEERLNRIGFQIEFDDRGHLMVRIDGQGLRPGLNNENVLVDINEWQHFVFNIHGDGVVEIYKNGVLRGEEEFDFSSIVADRLIVASDPFVGFAGTMGKLAVYSSPLSQEDVERRFTGDAPVYNLNVFEHCWNELDDDFDGFIDGLDEDCRGQSCVERGNDIWYWSYMMPEERLKYPDQRPDRISCCAEGSCASAGGNCVDIGVTNDGNYCDIDGNILQCNQNYRTVTTDDGLYRCDGNSWQEIVQEEPEEVEVICNDGIDNDGDERVDCTDIDCRENAVCHPSGNSQCDDGIDNDGDGRWDKYGGCDFGGQSNPGNFDLEIDVRGQNVQSACLFGESVRYYQPDVGCDSLADNDEGGDEEANEFCGNGIADVWEHCASCPADVPCDDGFECREDGFCVESEPIDPAELCGNRVTDEGENCASCPSDVGCNYGESCNYGGECVEPVTLSSCSDEWEDNTVYQLDRELTEDDLLPNGNCLDLAKYLGGYPRERYSTHSRVVIDCMGNGIFGDGTGKGINVIKGGLHEFRNCNLFEFRTGAYFEDVSSITLRDNSMSHNDRGVTITYRGDEGRASHVEFLDNTMCWNQNSDLNCDDTLGNRGSGNQVGQFSCNEEVEYSECVDDPLDYGCSAIGQNGCQFGGATVSGQPLECAEIDGDPVCSKPGCEEWFDTAEAQIQGPCDDNGECAEGQTCVDGFMLEGAALCISTDTFDQMRNVCEGIIQNCLVEECPSGVGSCNMAATGATEEQIAELGLNEDSLCSPGLVCAGPASEEFHESVVMCAIPCEDNDDCENGICQDGICQAVDDEAVCSKIGQHNCQQDGVTANGQELTCIEFIEGNICTLPECKPLFDGAAEQILGPCNDDLTCSDTDFLAGEDQTCVDGYMMFTPQCVTTTYYERFRNACVGTVSSCLVEDCGVGEGNCNLDLFADGTPQSDLGRDGVCSDGLSCVGHPGGEFADSVLSCVEACENNDDCENGMCQGGICVEEEVGEVDDVACDWDRGLFPDGTRFFDSGPNNGCLMGDVNNDGLLDMDDWSIWLGHITRVTPDSMGDMSGNGFADMDDWSPWLTQFGRLQEFYAQDIGGS